MLYRFPRAGAKTEREHKATTFETTPERHSNFVRIHGHEYSKSSEKKTPNERYMMYDIKNILGEFYTQFLLSRNNITKNLVP